MRHGQTAWNLQGLCQGQLDIPLNGTGLEQASKAKAVFATHKIETICCSPLSRARQTAEIVNDALNCPLEIIEDLGECGFGDLQGCSYTGDTFEGIHAEARGMDPEPLDAFINRAFSAVRQAMRHPSPVLIVSHGGVFWAISHRFQGGRKNISNAYPVMVQPSDDDVMPWTMEEVS